MTNPACAALDELDVKHLDEDRQWRDSDLAELAASTDPAVPTVVFCHGNLTDLQWAIRDGEAVRRALARCSDRPFRLVIWAWPSTKRVRGIRRDTQAKARRADVEAVYLARVLQTLPPDAEVALVGYSFGARVTAGALHLLSGGAVCGNRLPATDDVGPTVLETPRFRLILIAAAIDRGTLLSGGRLGRALDKADASLIACNRLDCVLKVYPLLYRIGGPKAVGRFGPMLDAAQRKRTELVDITRQVGKSHHLAAYLGSPSLVRRMAALVAGDAEMNASPSAPRLPRLPVESGSEMQGDEQQRFEVMPASAEP